MELAIGWEGPSIDDLRWHGLAPWKVPEVVRVAQKPRRVMKPRPVGVRVRIGPGVSKMDPPYDFSWHPQPTPQEMKEMFGCET